jgi:two-component system invasion response regulator UvrY
MLPPLRINNLTFFGQFFSVYDYRLRVTVKQQYMGNLRILLVDGHRLIRDLFRLALQQEVHFEIVGETGDGAQAIELARKLKPDIILMDLNLSPVSGFEAMQKIKAGVPDCKLIAVSSYTQPAYAKKFFQMGGLGYVTKNSPQEELMEAIHEVRKGNKYFCTEIKNKVSALHLEEDTATSPILQLTDRELQIINLVKEGLSSKEMAARLSISLKTVEVHRHNILKKLRLKNSAALVNFINTSAVYL